MKVYSLKYFSIFEHCVFLTFDYENNNKMYLYLIHASILTICLEIELLAEKSQSFKVA